MKESNFKLKGKQMYIDFLFEKGTLESFIDFPIDYPNTKLKLYLKKIKRPIFHLDIFTNSKRFKGNTELEPDKMNSKTFLDLYISNESDRQKYIKKFKGKRVLFISEFYNHSKDFPFLDEQEKKELKGLGKKMLCCILNYLKENQIIKNTDYITLVTNYDKNKNCKKVTDVVLPKNFNVMKHIRLLQLFKDQNNEVHVYKETLQKLFCALKKIKLLVKYYKKLGFKMVNKELIGKELMYSTVKNVLKNC